MLPPPPPRSIHELHVKCKSSSEPLCVSPHTMESMRWDRVFTCQLKGKLYTHCAAPENTISFTEALEMLCLWHKQETERPTTILPTITEP